MRIVSLGMVHPGPCGVRDHGALLAQELRSSGYEVEEVWVSSDGRGLRRTLRATWEFLREASARSSGPAAIWHYSVFAYSFRGFPLPGILLGVVMRLRGVHVVAVLHEMALPWDVPGRRKAHALFQHVVLPLVLLGSDEIVVTTDGRAAWLGSTFRVSRGRIHVIPVFSNLGEREDSTAVVPEGKRPGGSAVIAVPGWASSPRMESVLIGALTDPKLACRALTVELLGAPGPCSAAARRWLSAGVAAGLADRLRFTGVLPADKFAQHLSACDAVVLLFGDGPSSRHTMLAAAMAHGCPIVALSGPDTWRPLVDHSAALIVQRDPGALARELVHILDDHEQRAALGRRALEVYKLRMSLTVATRAFQGLLPRSEAS